MKEEFRAVSHLAAVSMVAIVLVIAVFGAYFVGTMTSTSSVSSSLTSTTTATHTTGISTPCNENVYNRNTTSTLENVPVLLMQPGSTAYICVTYQSAWQGNSSQYRSQYFQNDTYRFDISVSKEDCVSNEGGTSCTEIISHSFVISASPSSITPSPATNYVSVVYAITALANSTGFYDRSAPYDYCIGMPMAVGYSPSQVNASDFAPILIPPCPLLPFAPIMVSVGSMTVIYLAFGSHNDPA